MLFVSIGLNTVLERWVGFQVLQEFTFVSLYWHQCVWVIHLRAFEIILFSESVTQQQPVGWRRNETIVISRQWFWSQPESRTARLQSETPQDSFLSPLAFAFNLFAFDFVSFLFSLFYFNADDSSSLLLQDNVHSVQHIDCCSGNKDYRLQNLTCSVLLRTLRRRLKLLLSCNSQSKTMMSKRAWIWLELIYIIYMIHIIKIYWLI